MPEAVSTRSFSIALRQAVSVIRQETARRQIELQTGAVADAGLAFGSNSGRLSVFSGNVNRFASIISANELIASRLDATQVTLNTVRSELDLLGQSLAAGVATDSTRKLAAELSAKSLASMASALNTSVNGEHIFSGINSQTPPFSDPSGGQIVTQLDAAFLGHFGFAKSSPAASSITLSDFQNFLTTVVEPIFDAAGWAASVSSATDEPVVARISMQQAEAVSVTANDVAIRKAFQAAAVGAAFLGQPFSAAVSDYLGSYATQKSIEASQMTASLSASAGVMQSRVATASSRLSRLSDVLESAVSRQTAIDPYETGLRLNELMTTLESTILVSERIRNLSFLNLSR